MTIRRPVLTAIASGKGGTGKTFVATTLAHALSYEGERVLLFDGDLGLSNVSVHLGFTGEMPFDKLLAGEIAAHDASLPYRGGKDKRGGFDVLAGASGSGSFADADPPTVLRAVAALRLAIGYDRVILDLAAGVDKSNMRFAAASDNVVIVLTPDPAALTDAYAFVKLYVRHAGPSHIGDMPGHAPGFIVNQVVNAAEAKRVAEALSSSCRNFLDIATENLGYVRRDPKVQDAVRMQRLITELHPKAPAASDIQDLARKLSAPLTGNSAPNARKVAVR